MKTRIICVVDNSVKFGTGLRGEHGLAFWIETGQGNVLFDTGQSAAVLSHNLEVLGLPPADVDALALSHAHYDHTGGLDWFLSQRPNLPLYGHPGLFNPRYSLRSGEYHSIGMAIDRDGLAQRAVLRLSADPVEILPGLWTTGEIAERPEPQGGSAHLFEGHGEAVQPDRYKDDLSLVLKTPQGLVLICGCCHAGLLNTLFHVERVFGEPVHTVLGGTHLVSATEQDLVHAVEVFNDRFPNLAYYLNHCSGEDAFKKLFLAFGSRVNGCPAGTVVSFEK